MACWTRSRKRSETLHKATLRDVFASPANAVAFGFGTGLSPYAPGTVGTLVAVPVFIFLSAFPPGVYLSCLVAGFWIGVYACSKAAQSIESHDHPAIVWDEVIGYLVTMCLIPVSVTSIVAGFVLFRLFDIVKPWPINWVDRQLSGGIGMMADDLIAALFAALLLRLILPVLS